MPRMSNKAVPEDNGPIHLQVEVGSDQPTLVDSFQKIKRNIEQENKCDNETFGTAFNKPRAGRLAFTSRHGGGRACRHEDSQAHGGRRYCDSSSDAWG